jgi:hypothetical protein
MMTLLAEPWVQAALSLGLAAPFCWLVWAFRAKEPVDPESEEFLDRQL